LAVSSSGELAERGVDRFRKAHQPASRRARRQSLIDPKLLKDTDQVRLPTSVKAADPRGRLRIPIEVAEIRRKDPFEPALVLARADKALQLPLQNAPLFIRS